MKALIFGVIALAVMFLLIFETVPLTFGSGAFKRLVTISGIYAVCKPDGYPVVCFADKGSKQGGIFCLPLEQVGNKCL